MSAGEPRSTTVRLGSYEILHQFAKGGMAELFLARAVGPEGFQKLVVLKKILPTFAANPRFVRLFLDEAKLAASLDHPNIAHVHDLGMVDGHYFFTMEHVHGKDVRALLYRSLKAKVALPIDHVVQIASSVAAALHYAHERRGPEGKGLGIVHRDVSPSNIIVSYDGTVKLLDFGVAKAASSTVKTRTGALKGKVAYMSPEQAKGGAVDRRSDVFSTGIVMWEMTTARRLYKCDNDLATIQMIINAPPQRPSTVRRDAPAELDRIILKALAVDPSERYQTAQDLQADLEELAREHKLNQSAISLGRHMGTLFATEIDLWKRAEATGQPLSDHLIATADIRGDRPTPGSDMLLDAFSDRSDDDDDEDGDDQPEPSAPLSVEADGERTERSDVPVAPPPKVRYSRPGLEPRNWASEPSIVVDDSVGDDSVADADPPGAQTAQVPAAPPVVPVAPVARSAAPVAAADVSSAPLVVIAAERTEHVARLPPPLAVTSHAVTPDVLIKPARRTGVWIGFVAASVVAIAVGVFMSRTTPEPVAAPASAAPGATDVATPTTTNVPAPTAAEVPAPTTPVGAADTTPTENVASAPTQPAAAAKTTRAPTEMPRLTENPAPTKVSPRTVPTKVTAPTPAKMAKTTRATPTPAKPKSNPAPRTKPAALERPAAKFDPNAALPPM